MTNTRFAFVLAGLMLTTAPRPDARLRMSGQAASARDSLRGAWTLVSLDEPGSDGVIRRALDAKGSLIYTGDGRMSVQVMYAKAQATSSAGPVQYAAGGYEGSFGRYDVDTSTHVVTHHLEGANVRALVGKSLPRSYRFERGRLIIRSTRPDEHWSVTWKRP